MRRPWYRRYYPGWIVTGGGGSGGAATVQTDGVTLQGDGSSGNKIRILQVETDASLTGAGTLASTLGQSPITFYGSGAYPNNDTTITANTLYVLGFSIECPVTFSNIVIQIGTADNTNNSDVGIYNAAGTRVAHAGAQHMGSTGTQSFAMIGAPITILNAFYWLALTSAASTLAFKYNAIMPWVASNGSTGVSAGGALPASFTPPAVAAGNGQPCFALF